MLKTSVRYGFYAGLLMTAIAAISWLDINNLSFGALQLISYAAILLSCPLIYFGIKNIRERINGGVILFSDALLYGCLIAAIAAIVFAVADTVYKTLIHPAYTQEYYGYLMEQVRNSSRSQEDIQKTLAYYQKQMDGYTPFFNFFLMFGTVITIGVIASLFCARILKRDKPVVS